MWLYNLGISLDAGRHPPGRSLAREKPGCGAKADGIYSNVWRPPSVPPTASRIVWVHAASLGESEQARPIIERLRAEHSRIQDPAHASSPRSGYEIRKNYEGADYVFYLPADTPSNARRFLDIVHPEIAIFIKYEFWINLLSELRRRKVRSYIVSAIFRRNSVFFRPYGAMWRQALETFDTAVRAERRIETAALRDRVRQRGRRGRYALRPCGSRSPQRRSGWRRSNAFVAAVVFSWPDLHGGPTRRFFCRS